MDRVGRGAGARGGAGLRPHAEENLCDTDPDTEAAKEKDFYSDQKEIALPNADADPGKEILPEPDPYAFAAPEEKTFAHAH
jgi:hypothetical protein